MRATRECGGSKNVGRCVRNAKAGVRAAACPARRSHAKTLLVGQKMNCHGREGNKGGGRESGQTACRDYTRRGCAGQNYEGRWRGEREA